MSLSKPTGRGALRESLAKFTKDVESNGIRVAISGRRPTTGGSDHSSGDVDDGSASVYTLGDHMEYLHIHQDAGGHHYVDVSHLLSDSVDIVKDFCSPIPRHRLDKMYHGINETKDELKQVSLPVRTMTMRLAPHVMTSVVMDAVQDACHHQGQWTPQVLKRFLGHFQCLMVPSTDDADDVAFLLDVRICTYKTGVLERQLLLQVFYAADHKPAKPQSPKQIREEAIRSIHSAQNLMIPINLHLRGAASYLQYCSRNSSGKSPMEMPCPKDSPKASTAFFMGCFEPTFSVQLVTNPLLVLPNQMYPSLNSEDWSLLQTSWTLISSIWRGLMEHQCLFVASDGPKIMLDLHYCSQIRQISRDNMLAELQNNFQELQTNLQRMERSYQVSLRMCQRACKKYLLPKVVELANPTPQLNGPSSVPPVGYMKIAQIILDKVKPKDTQSVCACDQSVANVFKTFCSQDEYDARKHLHDTNAIVMARLVEIQQAQQDMIQFIERHPNTEAAAKQFAKSARLATNTKGRVARLLLARVPLMEFDLIGGKCQITASNMLCSHDRLLGQEWILVDLVAIDFQMLSPNCLAILAKTGETIIKLHTSTDIPSLMIFIKTLQALQTVMDLAGNYYVASNENEASSDQPQSHNNSKGNVLSDAPTTRTGSSKARGTNVGSKSPPGGDKVLQNQDRIRPPVGQ